MTFPQLDKLTLVVEASATVRLMITAAVKERGFTNVMGQSALSDALNQLETEEVGWIILPFSLASDSNTISLLALCLARAELRNTRISAIIGKQDRENLNYAFELGLLSYFPETTSQENFTICMKELQEIAEISKGDPTHIAAFYLRKNLLSLDCLKDVVALERKLCTFWPGEASQLINLSRALFETNDLVGGELALAQAEALSPPGDKSVQALSNVFLGGKRTLGKGPGERFNILDIDTVLLVDGDQSTLNQLEETFRELGIPNIIQCTDGEDALNAAQKNHKSIGMIVQEWRIPSIPGYAFIQRIRDLGFHQTPIIVLSSLLQKEDRELIVEFGANELSEKPFTKSVFVKKVMAAMQQERAPTDPMVIEAKIRKMLAANNFGAALNLYTQSKSQDLLPKQFDSLCAANLAFARGQYAVASRNVTEALRLKAPTLLGQGLLGKCLMALGHYEAAIQCFEKAQTLSPKNIERMCSLADAYRLTNKEEKSDALLESAGQIDILNPKLQASHLTRGLESEDTNKIFQVAMNLRSEDDVIALTNNRAVAFVRIGRMDDAVGLYNSILNMLPKPSRTKLVPVNYNIALAFVRNGDLDRALPFLKRVFHECLPEQENVKKKALSLQNKVLQAIETGHEVQLTSNDEVMPSISPSKKTTSLLVMDDKALETAIKVSLSLLPGQVQLHMIYWLESWPENLEKMAATYPRYLSRIPPKKGLALTE